MGKTAFDLMHVKGYGVPAGHNKWGYTNGGDAVRTGFKKGGSVRDTTQNPHKDSPSTKPRRERPKASDLWRKHRTIKVGPQYDPRGKKIIRAEGGRVALKAGKSADKNWIQKAVNPKHKGFCTPMTKKTCTPRRKALARTFKKMGKARKGK